MGGALLLRDKASAAPHTMSGLGQSTQEPLWVVSGRSPTPSRPFKLLAAWEWSPTPSEPAPLLPSPGTDGPCWQTRTCVLDTLLVFPSPWGPMGGFTSLSAKGSA